MDGVGGVHDADGGRRTARGSDLRRREREAVDSQCERHRFGQGGRGDPFKPAGTPRGRGPAASHGDPAEEELLLAALRGGEALLEAGALVFGEPAVLNLVVGAGDDGSANKLVRLVLNVKENLGSALRRHELLGSELGAGYHGLDVLREPLTLDDDRGALVRERRALLAESKVEAAEVVGGGLLGLNPGGDDARVENLRRALVRRDAHGALVEEGRLGGDDVQLRVAAVRGFKDAVGESPRDGLRLSRSFQRNRLGPGGGVGGGKLAVGESTFALLRRSLELTLVLRLELSLWVGMAAGEFAAASVGDGAFLRRLSENTCRFAVRSQRSRRGRDGGVPRFGRGAAGRGAHLACVVPLGDVIDAVDESLRLDRLGPEPGLAKGLGLLRRKGRGDPRSTLSARRNGQGRTLRFDARSHLEPAVDGGASVVLDGGLHANRGGSLFVDALVVEGRGRGLARLRGSDEEFAPRVLLRVKVKSFGQIAVRRDVHRVGERGYPGRAKRDERGRAILHEENASNSTKPGAKHASTPVAVDARGGDKRAEGIQTHHLTSSVTALRSGFSRAWRRAATEGSVARR